MSTLWTPIDGERHAFTATIAGHTMRATLDELIGLDASPVRVNPDGTITAGVDGAPHAPESVYVDTDGAGHLDAAPWEAMNGYSSQHGYAGPVMHASESIGGRMADDVLATPGLYVAVVVDSLDGDDDGEPAGWALCRITETNEERNARLHREWEETFGRPDVEPEPSSGRFSSVAAEAAWEIAQHGFTTDEHGESEYGDGYHALVDVSPVTLRNVGADELADRFAAWLAYHGADASTAAGALVWVRQTSDGQISVVEWGHDGGARSGTDAVARQWQAWVDTLDEIDD
jgi:hypothetical protein